ncbi:hypothetical protein P7K49_011970 [Saguinus oedipus]|uniref:Uncharacterized protein n=1 Tax=Saguinus oedipus TaxID=9490 RepID=A0ABQ9VUK4_SAGOE|nr:hypothetical protein P7K49_011970 [Saguinus oedipus]
MAEPRGPTPAGADRAEHRAMGFMLSMEGWVLMATLDGNVTIPVLLSPANGHGQVQPWEDFRAPDVHSRIWAQGSTPLEDPPRQQLAPLARFAAASTVWPAVCRAVVSGPSGQL